MTRPQSEILDDFLAAEKRWNELDRLETEIDAERDAISKRMDKLADEAAPTLGDANAVRFVRDGEAYLLYWDFDVLACDPEAEARKQHWIFDDSVIVDETP